MKYFFFLYPWTHVIKSKAIDLFISTLKCILFFRGALFVVRGAEGEDRKLHFIIYNIEVNIKQTFSFQFNCNHVDNEIYLLQSTRQQRFLFCFSFPHNITTISIDRIISVVLFLPLHESLSFTHSNPRLAK